MSISQNRLSYLFLRYYKKEATESETDELMKLVRNAEDDEHLSEMLREAWDTMQFAEDVLTEEAKETILSTIVGESDNKHPEDEHTSERKIGWRKKYWVAAAVVFFCISGALLMWEHLVNAKTSFTHNQILADIQPGSNRALLTLSDGSVIHLDNAENGFISQQGDAEISKTGDGQIIYKDADEKVFTNYINTVSTPRGGQYQIGLPDGSKVWLNASSSIKFPTSFDMTERRVEIEGEVFFEIQKDVTRPFRVVFGENEVEVLGTSFNIAHYPDEPLSRTTLVEGSIVLRSADEENRLRPGQSAHVTEGASVMIAAVDVEEVIAWKNGLFFFQDAGIESIMRQISRWYDIDVAYEGVAPKKEFDGKVPRSVSLSELLGMLEYAGLRYRIEGRKIVII
jgi:transmembrane sensor